MTARRKAHRRTVADLVRSKAKTVARFTSDQLKQLHDVFAHNDAEPNPKQRISAREARELLSDYGLHCSASTLERWACEALKRRSWGAK